MMIASFVHHSVLCADSTRPHTGSQPACDNCPGAWLPAFLVVVCLVGVSSSAVALIKHSSATFLYIVSTLPLTNLAFAIPALMDPPEHITGYTFVGLGVIVAGMLLYSRGNATEESHEHSNSTADTHLPLTDKSGSVDPSGAVGGRTTPRSLHDVSTVN